MIKHIILENKPIINSKVLGKDIYDLLSQTFTIPEYFDYTIVEVTHEYVCRPDLISYDVYGSELYSDVICKLNGISPFNLNEGMKIVLPTHEYINEFTHDPNIIDDVYDSLPQPLLTTTKQKRKANEAVIGDSRFKIDHENGIIIY